MDVLEHVMTRSNVMPRLNSRVLSASDQYVDFTHQQTGACFLSFDTEETTPPPQQKQKAKQTKHNVVTRSEASSAVWLKAERPFEVVLVIAAIVPQTPHSH